MEWPSKNVPPGGVFHQAKVEYSPETKNFLKILMDESKISMMQRKKINYCLRNGEPLPFFKPKKQKSIYPPVTIRPGSSKRRSFKDIVESGAYEPLKFIPHHPKIDREKEKNKLANKMAYGKDVEPKVTIKKTKQIDYKDFNRFDELLKEIKEREEFLNRMEELGERNKYENIIEQQIQARIREMETLKLN